MRSRPPTCALEKVYDRATLEGYVEHLAKQPTKASAEHVEGRLGVLTAHGPPPGDPDAARLLKRQRSKRATLEAYVDTAELCDLLDANMVERLRSIDEANFRSALAECVAAYVFVALLGHQVAPRTGGGRAGKQLEFAVTAPPDELIVEVKAPAVELPDGDVRIWAGDDAPVLEKAVHDAAKQFGRGTRNLLVIVPTLRTSVWDNRDQLVKALIGEHVMHVHVPLDDAHEGFTEPGFEPRGRLVRPGKMASDGSRQPAHTRVSAVMVIECALAERAVREASVFDDPLERFFASALHRYDQDNAFWPEYRVTVVHNPYAEHPISPRTLGRARQLVTCGDGTMAWTDRVAAEDPAG